MSTAFSRRAKWRAGLLQYGAEGHRQFGDHANADAKVAAAEAYLGEAALDEALDDAREALVPVAESMKADAMKLVPKQKTFNELYVLMQGVIAAINHTPEADAVEAAMIALVQFRSEYRGSDLGRGPVGRAWTLDNFAEPSDEELAAAEGGA